MAEAPIPGPSHSSPPALMETGRARDGQSWANWAEASMEAEFRQARPPKHPRSQSRKWDVVLMLPFPLQDSEGRHASVMRLYEHAVEQQPPPDGVAGEAIRHLHIHLLPWDTRRLGNQVACMIAEYHLRSSARVSLTQSPILPEAAKPLLPNLKLYVPNISFEGLRDVRVMDHAKALWVAVWLHRLDMSVCGDEVASETLDTFGIVWDASWSRFWFLPLMASRSGRSWRGAYMKTSATPNVGWMISSRAVIEFVKNSMALWRLTGWPQEPPKGEPRRTWTFGAVTSRASRLTSLMRSLTSERAPPKGTSQMTRHTEMPRPRCLPRLVPMTLPLRAPWLQSLALLLVRTPPWRLMRGLLAHLPPVLSLGMMMIFSLAMLQLEWRRAWPTSPSCPQVDKRWREKKPHMRRHLLLQRTSNCRTNDCS